MQGNMNSTAFGRAFLKKVADHTAGKIPENFFVYEAGWIETGPSEFWNTMKVKGCQFRAAKSGPSKGEFCVPVKGTEYVACVTKDEMRQAEIDMAVNELDEDLPDDVEIEKEKQRINEIKRKVMTAAKVYMRSPDGFFQFYDVGAYHVEGFQVIGEDTGVTGRTVKYSDVSASAKFFELVEMK